MPWQKIVCQTTRDHHDALSDLLEQHNASSITMEDAEDQPLLEPLPGDLPLWDKIVISALYEEDASLETLLAQLQKMKQQEKVESFHSELLKDQVWERVWLDDFHPMRFGDKLWIYPSTYELPQDGSTQLILDPGLAFGTGTHPTTALCLEWLDQHPPLNLDVIDYGCGSGILAIAAAKLGARHVIATDIDPQAIISTHDNMQRNSLADEKISRYLPDQMPTVQVDLLLANILSGPLQALHPVLDALLKPAGQLVLSGILESQTDQVIATYETTFEQFDVSLKDGWARITAIKQDQSSD